MKKARVPDLYLAALLLPAAPPKYIALGPRAKVNVRCAGELADPLIGAMTWFKQ